MDDVLLQRVKDVTPKFNPSVANGLAVEHMRTAMAYIDRLISINQENFPPGLRYEGSKICTPLEQFREVTREYNSKRIANIARYDTYMVKYVFSFEGEELQQRYVLLPFVRDGGLIHLNGALYNIAPVLSDVGYSVLRNSIFIPFRRTKLTFRRESYNFLMDNRLQPEYVIWSSIHKKRDKLKVSEVNQRRNIQTCLAHYFFWRWGVTETFRLWGKANLMVGFAKDFPEKDYPRRDFTIFQSSSLRNRHPAGDLRLVVPKEEVTDFVRMLVAGFFYVADTFPDKFMDLENIDSTANWGILLGRCVFGDYKNVGKLQEDLDNHMQSHETSLDEMTREDLRIRGIKVNTIWELLYVIMTDLSVHFYQSNTDESTMYGKRLMVLRYVLEEFNNAISHFGFQFQSNNRDKPWTAQDLNDALKRAFKLLTCIGQLTSSHGEINTVSYPGDNKIFRITSMLIPQDKAKKSKGYNKGLISDTSRLLHASILEVGSYKNQPKNNPDGRGRINPNVHTGVDGSVLRNPDREAMIDEVQRRLRR